MFNKIHVRFITIQSTISYHRKMKSITLLLLSMIVLSSCNRRMDLPSHQNDVISDAKLAFGSCNKLSKPQHLWDDILADSPDAFIWLGDIIYGDTEDMGVLRDKYQRQKSQPQYAQLRKQTSIYGIWDDHDYGKNDGGKSYPMKRESKAILFDFLEVPPQDQSWNREGAYQDYKLNVHDISIHLILLDERYFRDTLLRPGGVYQPNDTGTVLGETQWKWFEEMIKSSTSDLIIIGSGTQVFPEEHRFEKWANFPRERARFIQVLKTASRPILILSGDRHFGEISRFSAAGQLPVYEVTSSSLTHTYPTRNEPNKYRIGTPVTIDNYGLLHIVKYKDHLDLELMLKGEGNRILSKEIWSVPR